MKAKNIAVCIAAFFLLAFSAHAEFDDDILIQAGAFSLEFGWGLAYTPETLGDGRSIFPLLKFVGENYDALKTVKKSLRIEISRESGGNGAFYRLSGQETDDSEGGYVHIEKRTDSEAGAVRILLGLIEDCAGIRSRAGKRCGTAHIYAQMAGFAKNQKSEREETLTLYLAARKFEPESNEPGWTGEFSRSTLSNNMTKDWYHYAFYFSRGKAEEKARQNPGAIVRKVVCSQNDADIIDFSWETELEEVLKDGRFSQNASGRGFFGEGGQE